MLRMRNLLKKPRNLTFSTNLLTFIRPSRFFPPKRPVQAPTSQIKLSTNLGKLFSSPARIREEYKPMERLVKETQWNDYYIAGASDMGGTLWLRYCWQPEMAFVMMLEHFGVTGLPDELIAGPMGLSKPLHVKYLREHPEVIKKLMEAAERKISEQKDLSDAQIAELRKLPTAEEMFKYYEIIQDQLILANAEIIPYANETVINIQKAKKPFFLTTGFQSPTTAKLLDATKGQIPEIKPVISANEVPDQSRPGMIIEGLKRVGILKEDFFELDEKSQAEQLNHITRKVYFVTDSTQDVKTVRAVMPNITIVAVSDFGTTMRIKHPDEMHKLSLKEFLAKREKAQQKLLDAGATAVINDLRSLEPTLNLIAEKNLLLEKKVKLRIPPVEKGRLGI